MLYATPGWIRKVILYYSGVFPHFPSLLTCKSELCGPSKVCSGVFLYMYCLKVLIPHTWGAHFESLGNCQSVGAILKRRLEQTPTELCGCQTIKADMDWILDRGFEIYHPSKRGGCLDHVNRFDIDPVTIVQACQWPVDGLSPQTAVISNSLWIFHSEWTALFCSSRKHPQTQKEG